jgi:hypothetical protein
MSYLRAIGTCAAVAGVALCSACGLDLDRRDGELAVILLANDAFRDAQVVVAIEHDDVTSQSRHDVLDEVVIESVPIGSCRVSASIDGRGLVSNRVEVTVLGTARAAVGLSFFATAASGDDGDGDGIANRDDDCIDVANVDQADGDNDGVGDACDNCPAFPFPSQSNTDGDLFGDLCDADIDGDGVLNVADACPRDASGAVDSDGDRVCDGADNCPGPNPDQADCDSDGLGDACDADADGDGVANSAPDNCPFAFNPAQDPSVCASDTNACIPEAP